MARTKTDWTRVMFRTFKNGEVIALFIDEEWNKHEVSSYMHVGQHGGADYSHVMGITRRATPEEYAPLLDELNRIGYTNIEVMYRKSNKK